MSDASQFYGGTGIRPAGLINGLSGFSTTFLLSSASSYLLSVVQGIRLGATGAVTAAALKTALSLSGRGAISFLALQPADAAARTHRLKVTLDGTVIFDATSPSLSDTRYLLTAVGGLAMLDATNGYVCVIPEPLIFNNSLLVEYASSLTEANSATLAYRYFPR